MNTKDIERLKQTQQRLTFIIELLDEGVAVTNLNGTIHFANPAMARMHGVRSCRELIGKSMTHFYSADQIQTVFESMINTVKDCGHAQEQIAHTRKDGSTFPAQTKMTLLNDGQGRAVGLVILVTDLSQDIQQQSLTEHIEQLESANNQLVKQVDELKQVLENDSDEQTLLDPNEHFGSPLSIRRHLAAAKRRPCKKHSSEAIAIADKLKLNKDHLSILDEIAQLLKER